MYFRSPYARASVNPQPQSAASPYMVPTCPPGYTVAAVNKAPDGTISNYTCAKYSSQAGRPMCPAGFTMVQYGNQFTCTRIQGPQIQKPWPGPLPPPPPPKRNPQPTQVVATRQKPQRLGGWPDQCPKGSHWGKSPHTGKFMCMPDASPSETVTPDCDYNNPYGLGCWDPMMKTQRSIAGNPSFAPQPKPQRRNPRQVAARPLKDGKCDYGCFAHFNYQIGWHCRCPRDYVDLEKLEDFFPAAQRSIASNPIFGGPGPWTPKRKIMYPCGAHDPAEGTYCYYAPDGHCYCISGQNTQRSIAAQSQQAPGSAAWVRGPKPAPPCPPGQYLWGNKCVPRVPNPGSSDLKDPFKKKDKVKLPCEFYEDEYGLKDPFCAQRARAMRRSIAGNPAFAPRQKPQRLGGWCPDGTTYKVIDGKPRCVPNKSDNVILCIPGQPSSGLCHGPMFPLPAAKRSIAANPIFGGPGPWTPKKIHPTCGPNGSCVVLDAGTPYEECWCPLPRKTQRSIAAPSKPQRVKPFPSPPIGAGCSNCPPPNCGCIGAGTDKAFCSCWVPGAQRSVAANPSTNARVRRAQATQRVAERVRQGTANR